MDVTPLVSKGRQLIESYGDGAFKISGVVYNAPVIVFPESCFSPENFEADKSNFRLLREKEGGEHHKSQAFTKLIVLLLK